MRRSHIVPKFYLRAWAENERIAMRDAESGVEEIRNLKTAGVLRDFYLRERPDGDEIYDVEWSLGEAENAAAPLLRKLPKQWPPSPEDRNALAQFLGLQHLRGPAFRVWRRKLIESAATSFAHEGYSADEIKAAVEHQLNATQDNAQMLRLSRVTGSLFGSMHWTLVYFGQPWLATSDQPIVVWPLGRGQMRPSPNDDTVGLTDIFEVFVPLDPSHLLLMSWIYEADTVTEGERSHAALANSFCIANAGTQWFHLIGGDVPLTADAQGPLTPELVSPGYDPAAVEQAPRRAAALTVAQRVLAAPLGNDPVPIVVFNAR